MIYEKDSMDRLGDDLTEEVIQYLTFSDKVRLECVSKQWMRCVFNKQFVIEITEQFVNGSHSEHQNSLNHLIDKMNISRGIYGSVFNRQALESVLKKCPNIKKVKLCHLFESSLTLFGQYCPHLTILSIDCLQLYDSDVFDSVKHMAIS